MRGAAEQRARFILTSDFGKSLLDPESMITRGLYNPDSLIREVRQVQSGKAVPFLLGAILTIELAVREAGGCCRGVHGI